MTKTFLTYLAITVALFAIDMVWLRLIAVDMYQQGMSHLLAPQPRLAAAAVFYLLYPIGLLVFAVYPTLQDSGWWRVIWMGGLFGFFAYATYDLTNMAVLRDWPIGLSLIDMAWGTVVSAAAAAAGRFAHGLLHG